MGTFELFVLAGALAGGFVNGLTGFGTGLTALSFWLHVVPPVLAAPLVVACSIIAQLQTLPKIWHAINWQRVTPFIIGGLLGVPVGTYLLPIIPAQDFKILIGGFLIFYCTFMLTRKRLLTIKFGGKIADGAVGLLGGIMGGMSGLSGAPPSIWSGLKGWGKDERRSIFQAFNLSILVIALASQAISGFVTEALGWLVLIALPGTFLGVWLGRRVYDRLGDRGYDRIVYVVLLVSGVLMIIFASQ